MHAYTRTQFYPRDPKSHWSNMGMLKVEISDPVTSSYVHPSVESRGSLYELLCRRVEGSAVRRERRVREEEERGRREEEERKFFREDNKGEKGRKGGKKKGKKKR